MNLDFALVWNAPISNWAGTRELLPGRRKSGVTRRILPNLVILAGWAAAPALAWGACTPNQPAPGATVTCTGLPITSNSLSSGANNLTVNVAAGTQMTNGLSGGTTIMLSGTNSRLNISGTVDPSVLGLLSVLSTGVTMGNASSTSVIVNNLASGAIYGTGGLLGASLFNLDGLALDIISASNGTVQINNAGRIDSRPLVNLSILASDTPVIAVSGGGTVNAVNYGTINGRVGFQSSTTGNSFVNSGTINGSVSMGASSTNSFTAVTGSSVNSAGGLAPELRGPGGLLSFAQTGVVDGGLGGTNTLILQNSVVGTGSGSAGVGSVSAAQYINFGSLRVNSGTWSVGGASNFGSSALNGGVLRFSNPAQLGTAITSNGGTLEATAAGLTLAPPGGIVLGAGGLTVQGTNSLAIASAITGTGDLFKLGNGTLVMTGANTYTGGTQILGGVVSVSSDANLGAVAGGLTLNGGVLKVTGTAYNDTGRSIVLNAGGGGFDIVDATNMFTLAENISGIGDLYKLGDGTLVLTGVNSYGNTRVGAGTLIGNTASIHGVIYNGGTVVFDQGTDATLAGQNSALSNGVAGEMVKRGAGTLTLAGTSVLDWTVEEGTLVSATNRFSGDLNVAAGAGFVFDQSYNGAYAGVLSGAGELAFTGSGTITLTGDSSGFSGLSTVTDTRLVVNDTLGGLVTIGQNGTLGGSGTLTGAVTIKGTLSAGNSPGTLTFNNGLTLNAGSTSVFELNNPGIVGGAGAAGNDLIVVNGGTLTLGGTLDARVAAAGYYRLFNHSGARAGTFADGTVTGTGGFVVAKPNNPNIRYDVPGQVDLSVLGVSQTMQFWDGAGQGSNGTVDGGDGVWQSFATNWTNDTGNPNTGWGGSVGVFAGTAGTVTVQGPQGFDTLQILTDGYRIEGDALAIALAGGSSFNIGNEVGATVASDIEDGAGSLLRKAGGGTLVLTGNNTYSGGTRLLSGVLSVASDLNLGSGTSGLTFDGGVLEVTGTSYSGTGRSIVIDAGGGGFDIADAANSFTLAQDITGIGNLFKQGDGTLVLTGANTYGDTFVRAGTLIGNAASIRNNIGNAGTVVFDQAGTANFAGDIVGLSGTDGMMVKRGGGELTLAGTSTLDWSVEGGTLVSASNRFGGDLDIASGAGFAFDQDDNGTYTGILSGTGDLVFTGGGAVTLDGDNSSFTGLSTVTGSTLIVSHTLGGSALINNGGRVMGTGTIGSGTGSLAAIAAGGTLSGQSGSTLTVDAHLALDTGASVNVALGGLSTTALFDVTGDLTLDGTLNVLDAGGFGAGVYRLFDYGGALTDNGLDIGTAPSGIDVDNLIVQTAVAGRVNLISSAGVDFGFWDGGDNSLHDNRQIDGGAGVWRADGRNWTDADGDINGSFHPNPTYAVFQVNAGTVTVNNSAGSIGVVGMQFVTDGYSIEGDAIALEGPNGQSVIRVGDGSAAGASTMATIASTLTGASSLIKDDLGTLILTGSNSYEGDTLVRSGTLIGNTASIRNAIGNAGTVVFDQAGTSSFAGDIGGFEGTHGEMILRGGGVLTLEGVSTLDWSVEDGTLVSATDRFGGDLDIASGAAFAFNQQSDGTYAGALSGAGALAFTGGGTVLLTGDGSGFTGLSNVTGSTLVVNDTFGGSALIGVDGRLAGTGTIGSGSGSLVTIAAGGTLTPGNSIGTLTVDGDLSFEIGSRFEVEVAPGGTDGDLVSITGTATINGGTVAHIGMTGTYDPTATYTILSAAKGLTTGSAFDAVTSDFAFLNATLGYDANDITLTLHRNDIGFADVGSTRNQRSTAGGLESLGFGNDLYDAVVQLDEATARAAFDQLSGEVHASVTAGLVEDSHHIRNAANDRIRAALGDVGASATPVLAFGPDGPVLAPADGDHRGLSAWSSAYGSWGSTNSDGNAASTDRSTGGILMGADAVVTDQVRLGLLAGYSHSSIDLDARASSASVDSYHLGLYGGTQWGVPSGTLSLRGGLAYSWHDIETARTIGFIGFADRLTADYDASTLQAFGELAYGIETEIARFQPFVNLAHVNVGTDGLIESGSAAALTGSSGSNGVTLTTFGVRVETAIDLGQANARLNGMIGWRHAFGDTTPASTNAFAGSEAFTIAGSPIKRDALVLDAGLDLDLTPNATLAVSYQGQFASGAQDHGFKANLAIRF